MIEVRNFSKAFDDVWAVSDLSFTVHAGDIFAFLGANGSGKTTTIRALLGLYTPTHGALHIHDRPYDVDQAHRLGYLPEERGLYATSRTLETLVYFGRLKGLTKTEATKRARRYLERVELADKAEVEIKRLSSGQQQKIQLGSAIINEPELLILDEPTKGLDPVNRTLLMDSLLELNHNGSTIVFITHQMEEVERIADRILMVKDGRRRVYGGVGDVKREYGNRTLHITYRGTLPDNPQLYSASIERYKAELVPNMGVDPGDILQYLLHKQVEITRFYIGTPSLEQIFKEVYDE